MRVTHVGRQMIEFGVPPKECIVISMVDPKTPPANIKPHPFILAIHRVEPFHDIDKQGETILRSASTVPNVTEWIVFDEERARKIAEFVKSFERKMPPLIVAHCEAGICRSAGVAAAIQSYYPDTEGKSAFETGLPNSLVYRLTYEALVGKP
jgi:predicted protein tyrosine phosphatase